MADNISDADLARLSQFVAVQMGLHFPPERWGDLRRGIYSVAAEFGFADVAACIQWLTSSPLNRQQIEMLASHLTVGETYFFREKKSLEIFEEHVLPALIRSHQKDKNGEKHLRIWSAGCCTGEEPYTIAMLIDKALANRRNWQITILGTDINPRFLQKAAAGVYSAWSFRDTPPFLREKYFKKTENNRFEILPAIKEMVKFAYLNLAEDTYPSLSNNTNGMDVVFCRNVLMYLTAEQRTKVVHGFHHSLVDGGWLIVSPSEVSIVSAAPFVGVDFSSAILHRKAGAEAGGRRPEDGKSRMENRSASLAVPDPQPPILDHQTPPRNVASHNTTSWSSSKTGEAGRDRHSENNRPGDLYAVEAANDTRSRSYDKATALYRQGRYLEAAEELVELLSAGATNSTEDTRVIMLLAHAYANGGNLAEALAWCDRAIAADKLRAGSYYLRATILQERDQVDDAIAALRRALYLDPDFVLAHFALGNLSRRQGKLKEAGKHFDNALALLRNYRPEDILPESEGIIAGRLADTITAMTQRTIVQH